MFQKISTALAAGYRPHMLPVATLVSLDFNKQASVAATRIALGQISDPNLKLTSKHADELATGLDQVVAVLVTQGEMLRFSGAAVRVIQPALTAFRAIERPAEQPKTAATGTDEADAGDTQSVTIQPHVAAAALANGDGAKHAE